MKLHFVFVFALFTSMVFPQKKIEVKDSLRPYIDFLQKQQFPTAKDYILQRFDTYDIVVFSERHHQDIGQYELILDIVKDERFQGNLYTEVGVFNSYENINQFLFNSELNPEEKIEELNRIYRDLDYTELWGNYNYYYLLSELFEFNKNRRDEDKIMVFPLDLMFDWDDFENHSQYKLFEDYAENSVVDRNTIMGNHFVASYDFAKQRNPKRSKALVIENTYHGYIRIPKYLPHPTQPDIYSTGEYIYKTFPGKTTNVYINYFKSGEMGNLSNNGLFDASFEFSNIDNIGFDLKNTPFGNAKFDLYNFGDTDYEEANFDYIFDGMVYFHPVYAMELATGIPDIYPKEHEKDFFKRLSIIDGISYEESVRENSEYLKEINEKQVQKLNDSIILKIHSQINQWKK